FFTGARSASPESPGALTAWWPICVPQQSCKAGKGEREREKRRKGNRGGRIMLPSPFPLSPFLPLLLPPSSQFPRPVVTLPPCTDSPDTPVPAPNVPENCG